MPKPTKAQKAALRRSKESAAKRTTPPSKLDQWAISLYEISQSMKRAGFSDATIQGWLVDQKLPDWVFPDHFDPFEDEDEEEDDD
jgi:hypothetical protein